MAKDFHDKPYDAGTIAKLRVFEFYTQEWIPVFISQPQPKFTEMHIFDFFSGPGTDSEGVHGSPLRILAQLRRYYDKGMAGWSRINIVAHLFDEDQEKSGQLGTARRLSTIGNWFHKAIRCFLGGFQ